MVGTSGWRGPQGGGDREVRLLPAVAGVAAAEGDILHLEEVAAVLELKQRWGLEAGCRPLLPTLPDIPESDPPKPPLCLWPPHPHLGSTT